MEKWAGFTPFSILLIFRFLSGLKFAQMFFHTVCAPIHKKGFAECRLLAANNEYIPIAGKMSWEKYCGRKSYQKELNC
jgi:hypothetical protein